MQTIDRSPQSLIGAERAPTLEPCKAKPVKWWAWSGAFFLALFALMLVLWFTSGDFQRTPTGDTDIPGWMLISVHAWEAISVTAMLLTLYFWLYRPWRREGRVSLDGMLALAFMSMYWMDPLGNVLKPWYTYNTHMIQFGSWAQFLPGWVTPRGSQFAEPFLFSFSLYAAMVLPPMVLVNYLMRRWKRRYPTMGNAGLLGMCFLFLVAVDLVLEIPWLRSGVYTYAGSIRSVTLFPGHYYQFPLYEAFFWPLVWTAYAALRFYTNDKGQTVVERGVDELRASPKQKTGVRFLALVGFINIAMVVGYMVPMVLIHVASNDWPDDVKNRSYFTSNLCGQGTGYACPSSDVPDPHTNSAHLDENGQLIPAKR